MAEQLTASQRAALFAQATRQNLQMLPTATATGGSQTLSFTLPKARLLSKIVLSVSTKVKVISKASGEEYRGYTWSWSELASVIRRITLDLNNGFSPYVIGGLETVMLNMISRYRHDNLTVPSHLTVNDTNNLMMGCTYDTSAACYLLNCTLELPITLNDRDCVGLIMLQNDATNVTLNVDIDSGSNVIGGNSYTVEVKEVRVTPCLETFSIPANAQAFPDISVLKLTNSRQEDFVGGGQHIVKLNTGTIYRRIIFLVKDENGILAGEDFFNGTIDLVFNQADTNYSVTPSMIRRLNTIQYGFTLPKGMFVLDFSYQGTVNLGGSRDYIDTERLTEMWLRFTTTGSGTINLVNETLSRLQ